MIAAFSCDLCDRTAVADEGGKRLCHAHASLHKEDGEYRKALETAVDKLDRGIRGKRMPALTIAEMKALRQLYRKLA